MSITKVNSLRTKGPCGKEKILGVDLINDKILGEVKGKCHKCQEDVYLVVPSIFATSFSDSWAICPKCTESGLNTKWTLRPTLTKPIDK